MARAWLALPLVTLAFLPLALPPAASEAPLSDVPGLMDVPGAAEMIEELRASARTPAERQEIEDALAYLLANPEAIAHELLPGERKTSAGGKEEAPFSILRTDDRSKPVLLVHGRDNYDMGGYATLRNYFLNAGFSSVRRVGYYGGECNVELQASGHGSHGSHFGGSGEHSSKTGCNGLGGAQVHDLETDIRHMSWHLAWLIHGTYGANGVTVDALGHSMGGLMLRYAIQNSGTTGWPAKLRVEDVVTYGTPHGGLGTSWCKLSPWADVRQMCSDSSFMTWLKSNAPNPQGNGGTDWTVVGSDCDGWVAWNLAVDMKAAHKVVYVSPCYGHSDYYTDVSTTNDATVDYMDAPDTSWYRWSAAPHSGKWANYAETYGTW